MKYSDKKLARLLGEISMDDDMLEQFKMQLGWAVFKIFTGGFLIGLAAGVVIASIIGLAVQ